MSPFLTAILRSGWSIVAAFVAAAAGSYLASQGLPLTEDERIKLAVVTGLVAAFGPFATRGVVEGAYDQHRAKEGILSSGDVAMASPKVTVIDNATTLPVPGQTKPQEVR